MRRTFVIALLMSCASSTAPAQQPQSTLGTSEVSTISVPIRATLAPLLPLVEAQVPKTFFDSRDQNLFTIKYSIVRDPIRLQMAGTALRVSTTARYLLEACRGRLGCLSCGIDEPLRQANIALDARFTWDVDWRLRSTTVAQPVTFPNRCEVTIVNFDITDRFIAPVVNAQLNAVARAVDVNTPKLTNIRPMAQEVWNGLQVPAEVAPRTWLVFEPLDVALAPLTGQDLVIGSTLSMNARTRIIVGDQPAVATIALPQLQTREATGGLRVPFEIHLPYADATALANERYGHRTYDDLRIEKITIVPAPNGKIGLDATIDYQGGRLKQYTGPVHLEGTPKIEGNDVTVPDLDYVLQSDANLFMRFAHDFVRARLRESATFPLASYAETVRAEITKALSRQLSPGVSLHGHADAVQPLSVVAAADGIVVRVLVMGIAEVDVESPLPTGEGGAERSEGPVRRARSEFRISNFELRIKN